MATRSARRKPKFTQTVDKNPYRTGTSSLTVDDKLEILKKLGQPELIDLFKEWQPRQVRRRRTGAPLDQRVNITVTDSEKVFLENELKSVRAAGEKITASQFIRNRAMSSVDIHGWKEIALRELKELDEIETNLSDLKLSKRQLSIEIDESDDSEEEGLLERELSVINTKMARLIANMEKRGNRLSGRMTMAEAETVKWRAQRLCISTSDYLRMMIFALEPASHGDSHLSLDARRRFYISIVDVAQNGWGNPPTVYDCKQCVNYVEEIERLRERIRQLEAFG